MVIRTHDPLNSPCTYGSNAQVRGSFSSVSRVTCNIGPQIGGEEKGMRNVLMMTLRKLDEDTDGEVMLKKVDKHF